MSKSELVLAIVIVNYNKKEITKNCIDSLIEEKTPKQIILVDNGSNDGSSLFFEKYHPDVCQIVNKENTGFCIGNNIGISYAINNLRADYICLLNNDTIVTYKTFPVLLEKAASITFEAYMLTGKIYYNQNPNILWYAGGYLSCLHGIGKHYGRNAVDDKKEYSVDKRVTYASGCFMFFTPSLIAKVGMLNERLFMYMDDTDFCMRLLKQNIPIFYLSAAVIYHDVGTGMKLENYSPFYLYFSTRNRFWVGDGLLYKLYLSIYTVVISIVKIIIILSNRSITQKNKKIYAIGKGILHGLMHKNHATCLS